MKYFESDEDLCLVVFAGLRREDMQNPVYEEPSDFPGRSLMNHHLYVFTDLLDAQYVEV